MNEVARSSHQENLRPTRHQCRLSRSPIPRYAGSANLYRKRPPGAGTPATAASHLARPTARAATHVVVRPPCAHTRHFPSPVASGALPAAGHGFLLFGIQNRLDHPRASQDRHTLNHLHHDPRRHLGGPFHPKLGNYDPHETTLSNSTPAPTIRCLRSDALVNKVATQSVSLPRNNQLYERTEGFLLTLDASIASRCHQNFLKRN